MCFASFPSKLTGVSCVCVCVCVREKKSILKTVIVTIHLVIMNEEMPSEI